MNRRTFLTAAAASGVAAGSTLAAPLPATARPGDRRRVRSLDELQRAIGTAGPGTVITVADGHYPVPAGAPIALHRRTG